MRTAEEWRSLFDGGMFGEHGCLVWADALEEECHYAAAVLARVHAAVHNIAARQPAADSWYITLTTGSRVNLNVGLHPLNADRCGFAFLVRGGDECHVTFPWLAGYFPVRASLSKSSGGHALLEVDSEGERWLVDGDDPDTSPWGRLAAAYWTPWLESAWELLGPRLPVPQTQGRLSPHQNNVWRRRRYQTRGRRPLT